MMKSLHSSPVVPVWKSIAMSEFGLSRRLKSSPAWRLEAVAPFSLPGHSRFMSTRSMPRPWLGQRRCMPSRAGRAMSRTAMTLPAICWGSSWSMTICTVRIELISSPCTPLVSVTRLPGSAPLATITDT